MILTFFFVLYLMCVIITGVVNSMCLGDKYYNNYILDVDIDNIGFEIFNYQKLQEFIMKYYYDYEINQYVFWEHDGIITLYGMDYLEMSIHNKENLYLLGVVSNNRNGKTIVFCMEYDNNYQFLYNEDDIISYILYMETNYYFRNKGILKKVFKYIKNIFYNNDIIIMSPESSMGMDIGLFQRMENLFSDSKTLVRNCDSGYSLIRKNAK